MYSNYQNKDSYLEALEWCLKFYIYDKLWSAVDLGITLEAARSQKPQQ